MKKIVIKKSHDLSPSSKVYLHIGSSKIHLLGFGLYTLTISEGDEIFSSHLWTQSPKIHYEDLEDGISLLIKPRLNKVFALVIGILFIFCSVIFVLTRYRWSFFPLIPFVVYIFIYLTVLRNRYLIISQEQEN